MEEDKLFNCSMEFIRACDRRLTEKEGEGWTAWDNLKNKELFANRLIKHILKEFTQESLIDISNYCMFLWNFIKEEEVK